MRRYQPTVQAEYRKAWESLREAGQIALCALAGEAQTDLDALYAGVWYEKPQPDFFFSPLFVGSVHRQSPPSMKRLADGIDDARLQALIFRLRRKVEPDPSYPRHIVTVRGEGHKFIE